MRNETVDEFLARGGKIKQITSGADKYANIIPAYKLNSRFHRAEFSPACHETLIEKEKAHSIERKRRSRKRK